MNKPKNFITIPRLNMVLLTVLVGFISYTMFAPIIPATYDKPIVQDPTNLRGGHKLVYTLHACRYVGDGVLTTVTRKLISTTDKTLQPISLSADTFTSPAKCNDVKKTVIIPYSTPAGEYQLVITGVYQVIPLRKPITVQAKSDSFYLQASTAIEDIQALIDANTQLQEQIKAKIEQTPVTTVPLKGNGSSTTNNTTNNSTTNNTTNNNTKGNASESTPKGLVPGLLNALGGGALKLSL